MLWTLLTKKTSKQPLRILDTLVAKKSQGAKCAESIGHTRKIKGVRPQTKNLHDQQKIKTCTKSETKLLPRMEGVDEYDDDQEIFQRNDSHYSIN